ncbi:MAG: MBL fold metallo-hydrolase [Nitrospirae bacterium]|nr:MBL fold metallo-hydrolase [Nitrospirota bacterium]
MILERLVVGPLEENTYIIADEASGQAIVVDPGDEPDRIIDIIKHKNLQVHSVICTHTHFDHVGAAGDIKKATGAKILIHKNDLQVYETAKDQAAFWGYDIDDIPGPDGFIDEGHVIEAGNLKFKVLHTPGHSPGGICLYGEGILMSGDTIFRGSVGRTDFPGGSMEELKKSFRRLLDLPQDTKIYSGHGPETTVGMEKKTNFFVNEFL